MENVKFSVGDKVRVITKRYDTGSYGRGHEQYGDVGTVSDVRDCTDEYGFKYDVTFEKTKASKYNSYRECDLALVSAPTIATELRLKPQAKTVLRHLRNNDHISPAEALIVYGISRLAACVFELRKAGYTVSTDMAADAQGRKYARYSMAKAN